ncbi:MAG: hypothetical protein FD138_2283, partial [Planctomycetota bacterium]
LYFPPGDGPWPVLYEQRYADLKGAGTRQGNARLAKAGYVVCAENFRGAGLSEGTWVGYRALGWGELQDGYDTVEWLAKQKWSTGKIGTFGSSQAGFAQNFLAVTKPPHLVAQYMIDTGLSLYQEGYRIGGTTRPERFKGMGAVCREPAHNLLQLAEWFQHPTFDDYWKQEDCSRHFDKMDVPCFTIGSWFDFMNIGSIESYRGRQHRAGPNSRGKQQSQRADLPRERQVRRRITPHPLVRLLAEGQRQPRRSRSDDPLLRNGCRRRGTRSRQHLA